MRLILVKKIKNSIHAWIYLFLSMLFVFSFPHTLNAAAGETQRIWTGLDLFPSILAADKDIDSKTGSDGKLLLTLIYNDCRKDVLQMASHLQKIGTIHGIPIRIELTSTSAFIDSYSDTQAAGIFVTQRVTATFLNDLIYYGKKHHVIIFSPFKGDVERGVSGGIIISDRILPYINKDTLNKSAINLKTFFLRIARAYEQEKTL